MIPQLVSAQALIAFATGEVARNLTTKSNLPLTIGHYLKNMPLLADNWNAFNYKDPDRQRIYLKDIDCPDEWHDHLKQLIPPPLFYMNEGPEAFRGPGAVSAPSSRKKGSSKAGTPIARAGDLMSSLPRDMRAENLMCYIGHEGTYTPSHQEMCASLGHNIMVEASDGSLEHGKVTTPGSSIWLMTESKDRHTVSDYWTSKLGHDINIEDHFAQLNAWKAAPFKTYVVEQKPGDFILIPPLAAHQVWNRGTRTMKVAWNRTTAETLEMALNEGLSRARKVCRDEQYKNKAIVFYSLERYSKMVNNINEGNIDQPKVQQLLREFQQLFSLYTRILLSESFSPDLPVEKEEDREFIPFDGSVTCAYCRCNIFNRFLTCPWCIEGKGTDVENAYDICMECYVMGRSCACLSRLRWAEQFRWSELTKKHETWRQQLLRRSSHVTGHFQPLDVERDLLGKRTLAEICQGQLKMRPWVDITKPEDPKINDHASDSEDAPPARKRKKIGREAQADADHGRCHVCMHFDPLWKLASCSYCPRHYCYGSLYRAFNIEPQHVLGQLRWKCPKCRNICNCGGCRRNMDTEPFKPACILGHDTRKIADPRSTEALVDFRNSNLRWLQKANETEAPQPNAKKSEQHEGKAAKKRESKAKANEPQSQPFDDYAVQFNEFNEPPPMPDYTNGYDYSIGYENIPIDPALEQMDSSSLFVSPEPTRHSQMGLQEIATYALG